MSLDAAPEPGDPEGSDAIPALRGAPIGQREVDELAGHTDIAEAGATGWRAVAESGTPGRPTLPMLDAIVQRFTRRASNAVSGRLGGDVAITRQTLRTERFADYVDSLPMPTEAFRFHAEGWGGDGLVTLGAGFGPIMLDRLLGGGSTAGSRPSVLRPATAIEAGILSRLIGLLLDEASGAFSDVLPVAFHLGGVVEKLAECDAAGPGEEVLILVFELALEGDFTTFDLVLPASALVVARPLLGGRFTGEKLGRDDLWARHLATEMWQAEIETEVVLHEVSLPLGRILDLAVGDTLAFDLRPADFVDLRCGSLVLTRGRMGRAGERIAVQIAEPIRPAGAQARRPVPRGGAT